MQTFIDKVCDYVFKNYADTISDLCFVLPNRRASLFLRKSIAKHIKENSWSPAIYSIEDFIHQLSGFNVIDNTSLLFELYQIHQHTKKEKAQAFDEFIKWGQVLLHDFNEIDQQMAPAKSVFSYLSDLKTLSNWNPEEKEPTEFQQQYISFFESLYYYYEQLNKNLKDQKQAYSGLAYKYVADNIGMLSKDLTYHKIIFAGFNALSKSEENILFELKNEAKAELLWDADPYYIDKLDSDVYHEAGYFLRKYINSYKQKDFKWIENCFGNEEKKINIYGVPKQLGQAKLCGQLLNNHKELKTANYKSAIVLADENLLFPILNSLADIEELNATMGIPLETTPIFDFIKLILELISQSFTFKQQNTQQYHKNEIIKVLSHSIIHELCKELCNENSSSIQKSINGIKKAYKTYYSEAEIKSKLDFEDNEFLDLVFDKWEDETDFLLQKIKSILSIIRDAYIKRQNAKNLNFKIEIEYVYLLSVLLKKISNYQQKYGAIKNTKSFVSFFKQLSKNEKLALYGEPLKGLQLMGVLETRILDFEHLIMCGVNENILPSSSKQNSFIPFDIKRTYELPTYKEKNAVFAYHFFRLLQRAKNIHLIYNTEADPVAGGDKSRFIYQLVNELKSFDNIQIAEHIVSSSLRKQTDTIINFPKDELAIQKLIRKAKSGFSPSSLNTFKRCSLQFYYKEIACLGEIQDETETIDAATLGKVIHEVLQEIYKPFEKSELKQTNLETSLRNIDELMEFSFKKLYQDGNTKHGKNLLIKDVAKSFIQKYLKLEISNLKKGDKIFIDSLEKNYTYSICTNNHNFPLELKQINFKGFIDRVDIMNHQLRIIDYKTGSVKKSDLSIKDWDHIFTEPKTDKSFQLVFYAWLYQKSKNHNSDISSGIYSLKNLSQNYLELNPPHKNKLSKEDLDVFEEGLINMLETLFDQNKAFEQTQDLNICSYCNYKIICNK